MSAEFHIRVARAAHNRAIEMLAQSFHGPMLMSLIRAQEGDPRAGIVGTREHREFVEAVARRDCDGARDVMAQHLARTADRLRSEVEPA